MQQPDAQFLIDENVLEDHIGNFTLLQNNSTNKVVSAEETLFGHPIIAGYFDGTGNDSGSSNAGHTNPNGNYPYLYSNSNLIGTASIFSVSLWVKIIDSNDDTTSQHLFYERGVWYGNTQITVADPYHETVPHRFQFEYGTNTNTRRARYIPDNPDDYRGEWTHVAVRRVGGNIYLYINNELKDSADANNDGNSGGLRIGCGRSGGAHVVGYIHDVRAWTDHDIGEEGIDELYNEKVSLVQIESQTISFYTADLNIKVESDDDWDDNEEMVGLNSVDNELGLISGESEGYRISKPVPLSELKGFKNSLILWNGLHLENVQIYTMIKDNDTPPSREDENWKEATNNGPIPEVTEGESAVGKYYFTKIEIFEDE